MKLKRPFAYVGAMLFLVLAAVFAFGFVYGVALGVAATLAALAKLSVKNKRDALRLGVAAVVAAAALGLYAIEISYNQSILRVYTDETVTLAAHVIESKDCGDGLCIVTAKVDQIYNYNDAGFAFSLFVNDEHLNVGDQFTATVKFGGQSPYQDNLLMQATLTELHGISRGKFVVLAWAQTARDYLSNTVMSRLPEQEGGVAAAVITGNQTLVPAALKQTIQRAGIAHMLVISGLHITLIIGMFYRIFDKLRVNRYAAFGLLTVVIAACLVFYGASASVVRACIMCFVVYAARVVVRRADAPTSMSLAAIVVLTMQPSAIKEASFLLSFGCCFALTVVFPYVETVIKKRIASNHFFVSKLRGLLIALALSLSISVVTLPVMILFGMPVSLVAPLTNVAAVWMIPILVVAAFLMCVPVEFLSGLFGLIAGISAKGIIFVSNFFAAFSLASVVTSHAYLKTWLVLCGVLLTVHVLYKKELRVRKWFIAMCMVLILLSGLMSRLALTVGKPTVTLYRDSAVIVQDNGRALVVVDGIDKKGVDYLLSYLNYRYVNDVAYVIMMNDVGQATEHYLVERLPECVIVAAYKTTTPGIFSEQQVLYWQRMECFSVLTFEDGSIGIEVGGSSLLIGNLDAERDYAGYDLIVQRNPPFAADGYYMIGGAAYPCDREIIIYFQQDGTTKLVM